MPNFEKGQPLVVRVVLPSSVGDLLIETKPETLAMPHFVAYLVEAAITQGVYIGAQSQIMGEQAARQGSLNTNTNKTKKSNLINKDLERHAELIKEFWKLKKGSRGPTAWTLLMNELLKLLKRHGHDVVDQQLQLAINGKWASVSCSRYEQFKPSAKGDPPHDQSKHPAGRVFTARHGFKDEPGNPALQGLI